MSKFRVALSGDFKKPDGSPAFPDFDLAPLEQDPAVEYRFIKANGVIQAADLEGFDALILLIPRIEPESFPKDGRLALIARFGVGYDTVDVQACTDHDCALAITPDGVRRPVAVSIITFMLALTGKLFAKDRITREGPEGWARRSEHMGLGLVGRTFGSLGVGNIGAELFRLMAPFAMRHLAHDPYAPPEAAAGAGAELVDLETLLRESDVVSVQVTLTKETRGMISDRELGMMRSTSYIINTARGPVIDEAALLRALDGGVIAGAGIDVFELEPTPADNPLRTHPKVIATGHKIGHSVECYEALSVAAVENTLRGLRGEEPLYVRNPKVLPAWRERLARLSAVGAAR
jgi:D-3-phosphoglycerate dehydrogenase